MSMFLDMRSSMHSSHSGWPNTELSLTPEMFGQIGLQTAFVSSPVITLNGNICFVGEAGDAYLIEIVRGASYVPSNVIYQAEGSISSTNEYEIISFHAQDLSAPAAAESIYTTYVSGVSTTIRSGPEVFFGQAATP